MSGGSHVVAGCFSCANNAADQLPPREQVWKSAHWRVAHAVRQDVPGWLVVLPIRHITALSEVEPEEAAELGPLLTRVSRALESVTGCVKTYVALFAEAEGFAHLHWHVAPRMADQPVERRGPKVFAALAAPPVEWVAEDRMDAVALQLRAALSTEPSRP